LGAGLARTRAAGLQELKSGFQTPRIRPALGLLVLAQRQHHREGIIADLEAMKRVGIGGVLIMEVDQGAPLGPVPFAGPQWRDLFKHVCSEAARLGWKSI